MDAGWYDEHATKAERFARSFPSHHVVDTRGGSALVAPKVRLLLG